MTLCKNCFRKQFWTSGSAQTRKPALSLSCVFWLGHFPRSKIVSESSFYTNSYIITILNFFWGAFSLKKWRFKKLISHCILKMWFGRGRVTFLAKKNSEKAKLPKICISFGGSMPIAQIKRCHLSPPPTQGR